MRFEVVADTVPSSGKGVRYGAFGGGGVTALVYIYTDKNGRGTERHLPKTDESVVWPAGERR